MSFDFLPQNNKPVKFHPPKVAVLGSFSWMLFFVVLLVIGGSIAWSPVKVAIRDAWARSHAHEAVESMEVDDLGHAISELIEARKLSPEEPEVIRATITYLKMVKGDRRELAYNLRLLATKEQLRGEDQILYGMCLVELGRMDEARRMFAKLPQEVAGSPQALDLLARLQAAEGQGAAALDSARKARILDKDSPEARLQLAIENSRSAFPEYRSQSWSELWALCLLPPPVGIAAARAMLHDARFTAEDAKRLLPIVESHPHADLAIRLEIVSALIRFFPDQKQELIRREVSRYEINKTGTLVEMAAWLAEHRDHASLLHLIPPQIAASSRPLFTALIKALAGEGRWQEMKQALTSQRPPVSNSLVSIWLADAESHLQPDMKESRRQLGFAVATSIASNEFEELELAAALSERLGLSELALECLFHLANKVEQRRADFLFRARRVASASKDTRALLEAARSLTRANPSNAQLADELAYLRLLLGEEMEMVFTDKVDSPRLFRALAAYRLGDHPALDDLMASMSRSEGMSAGQRAVLSGLLAKAGKIAEAFQLAEKIPDALLLDEELQFLNLAR